MYSPGARFFSASGDLKKLLIGRVPCVRRVIFEYKKRADLEDIWENPVFTIYCFFDLFSVSCGMVRKNGSDGRV